jgi:hypothetical protein
MLELRNDKCSQPAWRAKAAASVALTLRRTGLVP